MAVVVRAAGGPCLPTRAHSLFTMRSGATEPCDSEAAGSAGAGSAAAAGAAGDSCPAATADAAEAGRPAATGCCRGVPIGRKTCVAAVVLASSRLDLQLQGGSGGGDGGLRWEAASVCRRPNAGSLSR